MSFWHKLIGVWFTLLVTIVPLIWLSNTSELFEFNKIIATYILTILLVTTWIARMLAEKRWIFRRTPLDIPILLFLGANLLSLFGSIDIHTSWFGYYSRWNGGMLSLVAYAALYWSYVSNMTHKTNRLFLNWAIGAAVLVAAYAGLEHFGFSPSCVLTTGKWDVACWVQDVQNRVFGTIGQPNWLGAYLVALIFIPIAKFIKTKSWLNLGIFALLFIVLLYTKSRSGLLALGISGSIFGLLEFRSEKTKTLKWLGTIAAIIIVLTLSIRNPVRDLIVKTHNDVVSPPSGTQLEVGGTESGTIRKIVWTGALRIWQASPKNWLIGTGPETFAESYYQYRPVEHNNTSEWELLYNKAHNEFLNYLATTGTLGLGTYMFMLVIMGWVLWKSKNWTLLAGWLTISVTNFWGFSVVIMQILLFILPAIAVIENLPEEKAKTYPELEAPQLLILIGVMLVGAYLLFVTGRYWLADATYAKGQNLMRYFTATSKGNYLLASYEAYQQAYTLNKDEPVLVADFGSSAAYVANAMRTTNATSAAQLATLSLQAEENAIRISPAHPNYYKTAAKTAILLSDLNTKYLDLAYQYLAKAHQLSPTDPRILFNMGVIAQYQNKNAVAKADFEAALKLKPDFADPGLKLKELK